jgi:hypothetical protein
VSGQTEEEVLKRGQPGHIFGRPAKEALAHCSADDRKAGTVQGFAGRGELLDDLATVSVFLDHPDDASDLPLGSA